MAQYGYVCENQDDYRALRRIADAIVRNAEMDWDECCARIDEICNLLEQWENRNV